MWCLLKYISESSFRRLRIFSVLLLCVAAPSVLSAAVKMTMRLENVSVLRYEAMNAFVTIENDTDELLFIDEETFGLGPSMKFEFDVYMKRYNLLPRRNRESLMPVVTIIPGAKRVFMIDVSRWYNVSEEGRYIIGAVLTGEKKTILSNKDMIDVVRGLELVSITKEVPGYEDELRDISVRYWKRGTKEVAFVSVDDNENKINYGVFQLGNILRMTKPIIRYDRSGKFTVTHQCRGDCYVETSFILGRDYVTSLEQRYINREGNPYKLKDSTKSRLVEELKKK